MSSKTTESVQALKFSIGKQSYCVEIEYVTEIIDGGEMTPIPNTDDHIEGLMDLRGQTTTVVNPYKLLEMDGVDPSELMADGGTTKSRVIMLEPDIVDGDGTVGWLVSDVSQVTEISTDTLEAQGITDTDMFRGVIKDEDGFTIWLDPHELTA